jgi:hypothetical protein
MTGMIAQCFEKMKLQKVAYEISRIGYKAWYMIFGAWVEIVLRTFYWWFEALESFPEN